MIIVAGATSKSSKLIVGQNLERTPGSAEALEMVEVAAVASALAGREIKRIVASDAEHRDGVIGNSVSAHQADLLLSIYAVGRCGEFGATDQALGRLLCRPTMSASDVLSQHYAS